MTEYTTEWVRSTPEQMARANELAIKWRAETGGDPIIAVGAAVTVLAQTIAKDTPSAEHEACVEAIYRSLRYVVEMEKEDCTHASGPRKKPTMAELANRLRAERLKEAERSLDPEEAAIIREQHKAEDEEQ
jgi:hypothetical protein